MDLVAVFRKEELVLAYIPFIVPSSPSIQAPIYIQESFYFSNKQDEQQYDYSKY
jgi:hypothetical protein